MLPYYLAGKGENNLHDVYYGLFLEQHTGLGIQRDLSRMLLRNHEL